MQKYLLPKRKADALSNGAFLIALAVLFITNTWWPGILVALWIALGVRQYLTGRIYDLCLTTLILLGLFVLSLFNFDWSVLIPVLFVIGGVYIIFREFFFAQDSNGEEKAQEMEDDYDDRTKRS
jgi:hypothetical protein